MPEEKVCPYCGSDIPADEDICPACGADLDVAEEDEGMEDLLGAFGVVKEDIVEEKDDSPSLFLCPECGAFLSEDSNACQNCGVIIEEGDEEVVEDTVECLFCGELNPAENDDCFACGSSLSGEEAVLCPNCNGAIDMETGLCPGCGMSLLDDVEDEDSVLQLCPTCGAFLLPNAKTCNVCGHGVEEIALKKPEVGEKAETVEKLEDTSDVLTKIFTKEVEKAPEEEEDRPAMELGEEGLQVCGNCGAFVLSGQDECGICGKEVRTGEPEPDLTSDEFEEAGRDVRKAMGLKTDFEVSEEKEEVLEKEGTLFLCSFCGAFMEEDADACPICGVKVEDMPERVPDYAETPEYWMEQETPSLEDTFGSCKDCGAMVSRDQFECPICGSQSIEPIKSESSVSQDPLQSSGNIFLCAECGAFVDDDANLCHICGNDLTVPSSKIPDFSTEQQGTPFDPLEQGRSTIYICEGCGAFLSESATICDICGMPSARGPDTCPNCGAAVMPGAFICGLCGETLVEPPSSEVTSMEDLMLDELIGGEEGAEEENLELEINPEFEEFYQDEEGLELAEMEETPETIDEKPLEIAKSSDVDSEEVSPNVHEDELERAEEEFLKVEEEEREEPFLADESGRGPPGAEADFPVVEEEYVREDETEEHADGSDYADLSEEELVSEINSFIEDIPDEKAKIEVVPEPAVGPRARPVQKDELEKVISANKNVKRELPGVPAPVVRAKRETPPPPKKMRPIVKKVPAKEERRHGEHSVGSEVDKWSWNHEALMSLSIIVVVASLIIKEMDPGLSRWFLFVAFGIFSLSGPFILWVGRSRDIHKDLFNQWTSFGAMLAGFLIGLHWLLPVNLSLGVSIGLDILLVVGISAFVIYSLYTKESPVLNFTIWMSGSALVFVYAVMSLTTNPPWQALGTDYPPSLVGITGFALMCVGLFYMVRWRFSESQYLGTLESADKEFMKLDYGNAARDYNRAIAHSGGMTDVPYYSKGAALLNLGRLDEALESVNKAIRINPQNEISWNLKGNVFGRMNRPVEAVKAYDASLRINPRYEVAWNNLGNTYARVGRFDDALKCYDKALAIQSNYKDAWLNKGFVLVKLQRYEEAADCADNALKAAGRPSL